MLKHLVQLLDVLVSYTSVVIRYRAIKKCVAVLLASLLLVVNYDDILAMKAAIQRDLIGVLDTKKTEPL
jgi:hypothetical protein